MEKDGVSKCYARWEEQETTRACASFEGEGREGRGGRDRGEGSRGGWGGSVHLKSTGQGMHWGVDDGGGADGWDSRATDVSTVESDTSDFASCAHAKLRWMRPLPRPEEARARAHTHTYAQTAENMQHV